MSTVFIIDDQASVRYALGEMLSAFGYDVGTYESAESFIHSLDTLPHGCVVADVRMPGMDGIELVRELSRRRVAFPVVLISGHADVPMAVAAIKAGAEDFIEKPIDDVQLVAAINRGLAGAHEQRRLQERVEEVRTRFDRLTPREVEVFDLVVQGYTSETIAARLGIGTRTVEGYRVQIMNKMQAESVAVLVRQAIRLNRMSP
ncbi:MAG TPA: response regulator [Vicinamibacterales bacterium]|jgi:two-component system response regulator FixJ